MTIYGCSQVEIELSDSEMHWKVFKPKTNSLICLVEYKLIFDITQIYKNLDHMNALGACLCNAGFPSKDIIEKLRNKFNYDKIHPLCFQMMTSSNWSTTKSKIMAHKVPRGKFANWDEVDNHQVKYLHDKVGLSFHEVTVRNPDTGTEILLINPKNETKKLIKAKQNIKADKLGDELDNEEELEPLDHIATKEIVGRKRRKLMI